MIVRSLIVLVLLAAPAMASDMEAEFGDWRVMRLSGAPAECVAFTGGDGGPMMEVRHRADWPGPPEQWPLPRAVETAPRGYAVRAESGDMTSFFVDGAMVSEGEVDVFFDEDGIQTAIYAPWSGEGGEPSGEMVLLRRMRLGDELVVLHADTPLAVFSLRGFTAAYGKLAEWCGISTVGVID